MAETYCGKNCSQCAQKESGNCPGCKIGPGSIIHGNCELSRCVSEKCHETCETCISHGTCGLFRGRDQIPDDRRKKAEAAARQKEAMVCNARILGKWLPILFWLFIPQILANILTNNNAVGSDSVFYILGQILKVLVSAAYGYVFFRLSDGVEAYRTAGICTMAACGMSVAAALLPLRWLSLMILATAGIVAVYGEYTEFHAHAAALYGVDSALSEQWQTLLKWYLRLIFILIGSLFVMLIFLNLGMIIFAVSSIGVAVTAIIKLKYLYRTANLFRGWSLS